MSMLRICGINIIQRQNHWNLVTSIFRRMRARIWITAVKQTRMRIPSQYSRSKPRKPKVCLAAGYSLDSNSTVQKFSNAQVKGEMQEKQRSQTGMESGLTNQPPTSIKGMIMTGDNCIAASAFVTPQETKQPYEIAARALQTAFRTNLKKFSYDLVNPTEKNVISMAMMGGMTNEGSSARIFERQYGTTSYMALAYSRRKTGLSIWKVTPVIIYMGINVAMHMKNMAPIMFCMSLRSGPFTCQNTAAAINPSTIT